MTFARWNPPGVSTLWTPLSSSSRRARELLGFPRSSALQTSAATNQGASSMTRARTAREPKLKVCWEGDPRRPASGRSARAAPRRRKYLLAAGSPGAALRSGDRIPLRSPYRRHRLGVSIPLGVRWETADLTGRPGPIAPTQKISISGAFLVSDLSLEGSRGAPA